MVSTLKVDKIQNPSSGTTAMTIDTSGRVLTPARPAFLAYDSSSGWRDYTAHGAAVDMVWGATRFNIGGHFSTSTGKFTCPVAGIYNFRCWAYVATTVHKNFLYLNKNGSDIQSILMDNDGDNETAQLFGLVQCSVGDLIHMKYSCDVEATGNVFSNASEQWTGFEGYLIG